MEAVRSRPRRGGAGALVGTSSAVLTRRQPPLCRCRVRVREDP
ncbi:hypothetical protein SLI_7630 [Streptomyces lividans 1326]|uniref:Uncharacterized protein n=1 Tax=Streptomyces lividans 1326 TaxID=1200984 RepID=A0A7U9HGZ4_STRLI|nr:hypothetical protein SLI_7630 [Streptomyces lividans 1326]